MALRRLGPLGALATVSLLTLVHPSPAAATSVVSVTVEELARRSDAVVVGTARASRSYWLDGRIVTDLDIDVQSSLRGPLAAGSRIILRLPGGIVGRTGQQIPGVVFPATGVPYMLFLDRSAPASNLFYVAHLTASVLPLATTPTGSVAVRAPAEGLVVQRPTAAASTTVMTREGVALEALARAIRSAP